MPTEPLKAKDGAPGKEAVDGASQEIEKDIESTPQPDQEAQPVTELEPAVSATEPVTEAQSEPKPEVVAEGKPKQQRTATAEFRDCANGSRLTAPQRHRARAVATANTLPARVAGTRRVQIRSNIP